MSRSFGLILACGPMFCGKSSELIRRLRRAVIAKQKVVAFKHAADERYSEDDEVVTHTRETFPSIKVTSVTQMDEHIKEDTDVIGIDEAQFFGAEIIQKVEEWADQGKQVIAAGLDQDYRGKPFGPIPFLLARADKIIKLNAVCMVCGGEATKTFLYPNFFNTEPDNQSEGGPVIIGSTEKYEARCRSCWNKGYKDVDLSTE